MSDLLPDLRTSKQQGGPGGSPLSPSAPNPMNDAPQPTPANPQPAAEQAPSNGTPHYGDFGHPADPSATPHYAARNNDGSNDNPDEFSEFRSKHSSPTEMYCAPDRVSDPTWQRGHAQTNQHPEAIMAAQDGTGAEARAAYILDDPRYAGGDIYNLNN